MTTTAELLDLINQARFIYVGVKGAEDIFVYFQITPESAKIRAGEIVGRGLRVEMGDANLEIKDTLYIESL